MPKTLVAIPCFNAERFIGRTLNSCVNQTVSADILVVDNASEDSTREIVAKYQKRYNRIRLVVNDNNVGRVGNWNRCVDLFDESPNEYIKFVFAGDELLPTCIERVEQVFDEQKQLAVVVWPYSFVNREGTGVVSRVLNTDRLLTRDDMLTERLFPSQLTGAAICHTYAKWAIGRTRFNDAFLGGATFSNDVTVQGNAYHINEVLSVFNLDCHQSFHKQTGYLYIIERAYTKALGLEKNRDWIRGEKYREIRDGIVLDCFRELLDFFGLAVLRLVSAGFLMRYIRAVMHWLRCLPRRACRKTKCLWARILRAMGRRAERARPEENELTQLVLYANSFCNAHCPMCVVGVNSVEGIARPLGDAPSYFSLALLEKILKDDLIAGRRICTSFLMTEPLLTPELPQMLQLCKQMGHVVKVTTNGLLLAKRAPEISPYVDSVQVSLDGVEEIHDAIRGKGFFAAAVEGIRTLREINPRVDIELNFTVTNLNYTGIMDFVLEIDSMGLWIDLLKIQLLDFVSEEMRDRHNRLVPDIPQVSSSLGSTIALDQIDTEELYNQIGLVRDYAPAFMRKIAFKPPVHGKSQLDAYFSTAGDVVPSWDKCHLPCCSLAVNTAGKAFWHMRCFNDYILGDVHEKTLREIFYGEKAEHFRTLFRKSNYCFPACSRCCGVMPME